LNIRIQLNLGKPSELGFEGAANGFVFEEEKIFHNEIQDGSPSIEYRQEVSMKAPFKRDKGGVIPATPTDYQHFRHGPTANIDKNIIF